MLYISFLFIAFIGFHGESSEHRHLPVSTEPGDCGPGSDLWYRHDELRLVSVHDLDIIDPSGLDLHTEPGLLWTVSDEPGGTIYLITTEGEIVSTVPYFGTDMEGITYDPESETLWVLEERARTMVQVDMEGMVRQTVSLDIGQPNPNDGPEGITRNHLNGHFFVANEKNPRVIWELSDELVILSKQQIDFPAPFDLDDLSGLFHEPVRDELWILSDESRKIVVTDTDLTPLRYYELDFPKPEGIAVDFCSGKTYVVSDEEDRLYVFGLTSTMQPIAHPIRDEEYHFEYWSADEPDFSYPPSMVFQMSRMSDPMLDDEMTDPYFVPHDDYNSDDLSTLGFPYNNTRRTRINGLGDEGILFLNTGRERDLGAAVLALDTRGADEVLIDWLGGTLLVNNRVYAIRLQYRVGVEEDFRDLTINGEPVEYFRSPLPGHTLTFHDIRLPLDALDQPYVQLRWKYYYTGMQVGGGARDGLRLDNIHVRPTVSSASSASSQTMVPERFKLEQNYPNPFNPATRIAFRLPETTPVHLAIYNITGQKMTLLIDQVMPAGRHKVEYHAEKVPSGVYLYRLNAGPYQAARVMSVIK